MPNHDTEEWKISAWIEFQPKQKYKEIVCTKCNGNGKTNMCFGSLDDPEDCWECNRTGKKTVLNHPKTSAPTVPQELIDYMKMCYLEYKLK